MPAVQLRFYEELNDFLAPQLRKLRFSHGISGHPGIKDVIESLGVPHTEVDLILVNGKSVDFSYQVQAGDDIAVYPVFEKLDISPLCRLRPAPLRQPRFIADAHLGKLAKYLRMSGFACNYRNDFTAREIVRLVAADAGLIVLTRGAGLLKCKLISRGYWVRSPEPLRQLREVLQSFQLQDALKPFTLCLVCNGELQSVPKAEIEACLPPKVKAYFKEFMRCSGCLRIYWKGTHYERMTELLRKVSLAGRD